MNILKKLIIPMSFLLLGIIIEKLIQINNNNKVYHDVELNKDNSNHMVIKKGEIYVKEFFNDSKDPFNKPIYDTITILEIKKSLTNPEFTYVKWTLNKWKDTTSFISSDYEYLENSIKKISN